MKQCGIYMIENKVNGKRYIGSSTDMRRRLQYHRRKLRGNVHFNSHLQAAFNKYGEDNFDFLVLVYLEEHERLATEVRAIQVFKTCDRAFGYNISPDPVGKKHSRETCEKMSRSRKGHTTSPETRQKISRALRASTVFHEVMQSAEYQQKQRENLVKKLTGKPLSEEHRKAISDGLKASEVLHTTMASEEYKQKISKAHKGRKVSEETRRKLSESHKGHTHSPETRRKMSEARQLRFQSMNQSNSPSQNLSA